LIFTALGTQAGYNNRAREILVGVNAGWVPLSEPNLTGIETPELEH